VSRISKNVEKRRPCDVWEEVEPSVGFELQGTV
jgi:hypothetical protein